MSLPNFPSAKVVEAKDTWTKRCECKTEKSLSKHVKKSHLSFQTVHKCRTLITNFFGSICPENQEGMVIVQQFFKRSSMRATHRRLNQGVQQLRSGARALAKMLFAHEWENWLKILVCCKNALRKSWVMRRAFSCLVEWVGGYCRWDCWNFQFPDKPRVTLGVCCGNTLLLEKKDGFILFQRHVSTLFENQFVLHWVT